jgi:hypothetical protein
MGINPMNDRKLRARSKEERDAVISPRDARYHFPNSPFYVSAHTCTPGPDEFEPPVPP